MNKEVLEDNWILPKIIKIINLKPEEITTVNNKIRILSVFFNKIEEFSNRGRMEIGYSYNENSYFLSYLVRKYSCEQYLRVLNDKYHSHDFTYEETDFFELVLNDKKSLIIEDLNDFEKGLVCRMGGERYGKLNFELIEYIRDLILINRNNNLIDIEDFIFD